MSEARRYQQLRAHLSYLKLNDAAEALPRVLDQARAEQTSLTMAMCPRTRQNPHWRSRSVPTCGHETHPLTDT